MISSALGDDALHQLAGGRDVVDQPHHSADPPDASVQITRLVYFDAALSGHQMCDVLELPSPVEDVDDLAGDGITREPTGVAYVSAVMSPRPPASETAAASSARPTHCMPPCTIGFSMPNVSVNLVDIN